jgi:transposase
MTKKRKRYTAEFKIEALRLVRESGKPVMQIARELGIQADLLHSWKRQAEKAAEVKDAFPGNGAKTGEEAENERLRRELERVTQERDFLKKAAAYFAQQSR